MARKHRWVERPPLSESTILVWADDHHARTGRWPIATSGWVIADRNEKWANIDQALKKGLRCVGGGSSLARLLARERGVRNKKDLPPLTKHLIAEWATEHHARTGTWPSVYSGPVDGAPGEDWNNIEAALRDGSRRLPGGDTLARLIGRCLGVRNRASLPVLSIDQILEWADCFRKTVGHWPDDNDSEMPGTGGEKWSAIDGALREGLRGLPGRSSLCQLLFQYRGVRGRAAKYAA
jgi:hypothetical protein